MSMSVIKLLKRCPPTFVCGCPHSGSTLMQAVIGSHTNIYLIKRETRVFFETYPTAIRRHTKRFYVRAVSDGRCGWVEKTPEHLHRVNRILMLYNTAKIIIMIRDGRDVAASLFDRTSDLEDSVRRWIDDNALAMKHSSNPRVLLVKYEDLVLKFKETMAGVFDFIGEEYEETVVDYYKNYAGAVKPKKAKLRNEILELREWQVSQPLFDGRGRHKEFSEEQYDYVYSMQKEMLLELGYIE